MKTARVLQITGMVVAMTVRLCAQGNLYLSNLGEPSYDGGPFNDGETVDPFQSLSAGFVTGVNSGGYVLDSVQVLMGGTELGPGSFNISIYNDNNGQSGTSLGQLTGSPTPYIAGTYAYTSSGISLSASTSYWIVMSTTISQSYIWEDTISPNYESSDGWSDIASPSGQQLKFAVSAISVPESSAWALLTSCTTILVLFRNSLLRQRFVNYLNVRFCRQHLSTDYRAAGYFIGSGMVEAGCKTVSGGRCKISGMFWSESGAQNILALRCIYSSRRLEDFWKYRLNEQKPLTMPSRLLHE